MKRSSQNTWVGPKCNNKCSYKKNIHGRFDKKKKRRQHDNRDRDRNDAATSHTDCLEPPEVNFGIFSTAIRGHMDLLTPGFQTSGPENHKE